MVIIRNRNRIGRGRAGIIVRTNAALLSSALEALLHNAAQALGSGPGRIILRARDHGGELVIEVEDNGCGMDEATCARVFEPFFTTRPVGQGRGLGLSSAYRFVASHGGRIVVRSRLGRSSCFRVTLPLGAASLSAPRAGLRPPHPHVGGKETWGGPAFP